MATSGVHGVVRDAEAETIAQDTAGMVTVPKSGATTTPAGKNKKQKMIYLANLLMIIYTNACNKIKINPGAIRLRIYCD
jgi:pectate lyase